MQAYYELAVFVFHLEHVLPKQNAAMFISLSQDELFTIAQFLPPSSFHNFILVNSSTYSITTSVVLWHQITYNLILEEQRRVVREQKVNYQYHLNRGGDALLKKNLQKLLGHQVDLVRRIEQRWGYDQQTVDRVKTIAQQTTFTMVHKSVIFKLKYLEKPYVESIEWFVMKYNRVMESMKRVEKFSGPVFDQRISSLSQSVLESIMADAFQTCGTQRGIPEEIMPYVVEKISHLTKNGACIYIDRTRNVLISALHTMDPIFVKFCVDLMRLERQKGIKHKDYASVVPAKFASILPKYVSDWVMDHKHQAILETIIDFVPDDLRLEIVTSIMSLITEFGTLEYLARLKKKYDLDISSISPKTVGTMLRKQTITEELIGCVKWLVGRGLNVKSTPGTREITYKLCCRQFNSNMLSCDLFEYLLQQGASVMESNRTQNVLGVITDANDERSLKLLKIALQYGADVNYVPRSKQAPVLIIKMCNFWADLNNSDIELEKFKLVLDAGTDVTVVDKTNFNAARHVLREQFREYEHAKKVLELLLARGASFDTPKETIAEWIEKVHPHTTDSVVQRNIKLLQHFNIHLKRSFLPRWTSSFIFHRAAVRSCVSLQTFTFVIPAESV